MPTITLSEAGKALEGKVRFVFANGEFELDGNGKVETEDRATVAEAANNPYLDVELGENKTGYEETQAIQKAALDSHDPHVNPQYDHLSDVALESVVKDAQANAERIRAEAAGEQPAAQEAAGEPSTPRGFAGAQVTKTPDPTAQTTPTEQGEN